MSRALVFLFLAVQLFCITSWAAPQGDDPAPEINLQEPPFWMPSYDEFKNLRPVQKEYYLKKVLPALQKIPGLEKVSQNSLEEASIWYKSWDGVRLKLYTACLKDSLAKACDEVADVRIKTLENYSVKKNGSTRP
ncbi:hypothetical protein AZI86_09645 [Bdellovibrio bacteriovorus]|uniref:Uncharacterized protein n=1 Tax=Bdellovibrio bacteriovorus TaxID=959 RepID=A0A150WSA9_BDEBC|nr:hypothetical protein [Bdellovibrio bacteriovorus]KYG67258.1 hypothetical protein AZI86_09645 [Bdellovibrio bacteriovorus]